MQCNANSPRAEGEWFKSTEMAIKGLSIPPPPEGNTLNDNQQELDIASSPEIKDTNFEEGELQMTQEEINDTYSEYLKDQQNQDKEMKKPMFHNLEKPI